jgi:ribosomal protein S18 acetylase RimI-like enzyme
VAVNREDLVLRRISEVDNEILKGFTCGRDELDEFIRDDARGYDDYGLTETILVFLDGILAGYFSLSADSVKLSTSEKFDLGIPFDAPINAFPAVKLTKLAVCSEHQSAGIGKVIMDMIYGIVASAPFAVRLLTVDAVNDDRVLSFYRKSGFIDSLVEEKGARGGLERRTILMFKDMFAPDN